MRSEDILYRDPSRGVTVVRLDAETVIVLTPDSVTTLYADGRAETVADKIKRVAVGDGSDLLSTIVKRDGEAVTFNYAFVNGATTSAVYTSDEQLQTVQTVGKISAALLPDGRTMALRIDRD